MGLAVHVCVCNNDSLLIDVVLGGRAILHHWPSDPTSHQSHHFLDSPSLNSTHRYTRRRRRMQPGWAGLGDRKDGMRERDEDAETNIGQSEIT